MGLTNPLAIILSFLTLLTLSPAQSCWRQTPCTGPTETAFPGPWEENIYAPSSRIISPKSILSRETGDIISSYPGAATLQGNGSQLVFDFGIEVGGLITLNYTSDGAGSLGLAFTEAKNWIGEFSDASNGLHQGPDGALYAEFPSAGAGSYIMPDVSLRGGFRYLTIFLLTGGNTSVDITDIKLEIGFQPTWSNLRAYQGYFHSNDEMLNRIWYSGAYTLQTNAAPVNTGRWVPMLKTGWANNGTLGPGDTIIMDGAKRDRAVWPGDMGIAVPSVHVSTGELDSIRNALQVMYDYQNPTTGAFPEAGPPLLQLGSDTYHMWTMIGSYNYVLYTNDTAWMQQNWAKYLKAMDFIYAKVDSVGLLNVTGLRDWARWQTGYNNTQANMILYRTLLTGASLSTWMNDTTNLTSTWKTQAATLKTAINKYCFDTPYGSFKDNATSTTLYPQDANSLALLFSLVDSPQVAESISANLLKSWTPIGAETPELPRNISPFISSFEIQGHFTIRQTQRALDLIRRGWGWYLNHPNGTGSTVIEGYLTDGSFGYRDTRGYANDASYISHAHGWSSGPTSALTEFVLGLSVTSPVGKNWRLAPQFGDLKTVEGGFVTSLGKFRAGWVVEEGAYTVEFSVPDGTSGELVLPCLTGEEISSLEIDGVGVEDLGARLVGDSIVLTMGGGSHIIAVS